MPQILILVGDRCVEPALGRVRVVGKSTCDDIGAEGARGPGGEEPQLEGAAAIDPVVEQVRGRLPHKYRLQGGRLRRADHVCGLTRVGAAQHADLAVRPRLLRDPLHGVVAVTVAQPASSRNG